MAEEQSNLTEKSKRSSVFEIAPIMSGLLAFLFLLVDFIWFYISLYVDPEGNAIPPFLYSLSWITSNLLCIVLPILAGVVLGIINFFYKYRNKALAILGLGLCLIAGILSCLSYIVLFIWLVILGLSGV